MIICKFVAMIIIRRVIFLTIALLFCSLSIFAQNGEKKWSNESFTPTPDTLNSTFFATPTEEIVPMGMQRKMDFDMEVGTSFSTNMNGAWSNSTWFSPHIHYQVSPRFSISGGARIVKNNFMGNNDQSLYSYPFNPYFYQSSYVYVKGNYQVNEKLSLNAALYKSFNLPSERGINQPQLPESYGVNFGVDYKVSEKTRIELQIGISRDEYPQFPRYNGDNFFQFDENNSLFYNQNSPSHRSFFR